MNPKLAIVSRASAFILIFGFLLIPCLLVLRVLGPIGASIALTVEISICLWLVWRFLKQEDMTISEFAFTPASVLFEARPFVSVIASLAFLLPGIYIAVTAFEPRESDPNEMSHIEQMIFGIAFMCFGVGWLGVALPATISMDDAS